MRPRYTSRNAVPRRNKDRDLGSDGGVRHRSHPLLVVQQNVGMNIELLLVMPNYFRCVLRIRVNRPEVHTRGREFAFEPLDLGNVAVGDGTIRRGEEKHDRARCGRREPIDGTAIEIDTEGLRRTRSGRTTNEQNDPCAQRHLCHGSTSNSVMELRDRSIDSHAGILVAHFFICRAGRQGSLYFPVFAT
jgi:hypothetical protein